MEQLIFNLIKPCMNGYFTGLLFVLIQFHGFSQDSLSGQNDPSIVFIYDKPAFDFSKWYVELEDSIPDIEGNYYHTIKLGNQIWMKENLKVTKYNDGKSIPLIQDSSEWINAKGDGYSLVLGKSASPKYFYNYKVVNNTSNVCPCGWRIPDSSDWQILEDYAKAVNLDFTDGNGDILNVKNDTTHLRKEIINSWESEIEGLSFSNQPFGYRNGITGKFLNAGSYGYWWSKSGTKIASAWARIFVDRGFGIDDIHLSEFIYQHINYGFVENHGLSIRCIQE